MAEAARTSRSQESTDRRQHRAEVQAAGDRRRRLRLVNSTAKEIDEQQFISRITKMHNDKTGLQQSSLQHLPGKVSFYEDDSVH